MSVHTSRIVLLFGGLLTLAFLAVMLYPPSLAGTVERAAYDGMVRMLGGTAAPSDVVVVDVDEASLAKLGQWPWPRYRIAALVGQAAALGARSIAVDFLFSEPDRLSLNEIGEMYRRDRGVNLDAGGVPDDMMDNDRILAEAVARHKAVLGADLRFGGASSDAAGDCGPPFSVGLRALPGTEGTPPVPQASGMVCPIPVLAGAAGLVGATNTLPDRDGILRRTPLVLLHGERCVPGLAVAAVLAASGEKQAEMLWSSAGVLELRLGRIAIPTDSRGNMLLPFRGRAADRIPHIPAADLLGGRVAPGALRGKIVFIGSSASGLQDAHATPVSRACSGVDLHALAADAMLRGDFFVEPAWNRSVQVLAVIAAGLFITGLAAWTSVTLSALATGVIAAGLMLASWAAFNRWGVYCSPVPGTGMLLLGLALLTLVRLRREEKHAYEQVRSLSVAQNCALLGLVSVAETRDPDTGHHIIRTQYFVKTLAEYLGKQSRFHDELTGDNIEAIVKSAPLHDIGKVGVPDSILLKPGPLTDEEYRIMKLHTLHGEEVLKRAEGMAGISEDMSFLRYGKEVARSHHEKWDGTGYPDGLKEEEIPLAARLMALADVYDALCAKRVYKAKMPQQRAEEIIRSGRGTYFDPGVVDAFLALRQPFQDILAKYADSEEPPSREQ